MSQPEKSNFQVSSAMIPERINEIYILKLNKLKLAKESKNIYHYCFLFTFLPKNKIILSAASVSL